MQVNSDQSISLQEADIEKSPMLRLYPNPGSGRFIIDLNVAENINVHAKIELVNMIGQTVSTENGSIHSGKLQRIVLMPPSLSKGIYTVG